MSLFSYRLVIVNGQKNKLNVYFDNQADQTYTVNYISGALVKADDFSTIVRNVSDKILTDSCMSGRKLPPRSNHFHTSCQLSVFKYDLTIPAKQKVAIPYQFHSEFAPQDLGLTVIIDFSDSVSLNHREDKNARL